MNAQVGAKKHGRRNGSFVLWEEFEKFRVDVNNKLDLLILNAFAKDHWRRIMGGSRVHVPGTEIRGGYSSVVVPGIFCGMKCFRRSLWTKILKKSAPAAPI